MITLKTYGPSARGDARTVAQQGTIFSADFAAGEYSLGGDRSTFADLFTHTRGAAVRYLHPVTGQITLATADEPVFIAPDGQRALTLVGAIGAIAADAPTGAGSTVVTFSESDVGRTVPVICCGPEGAEVTIGGDVEIVGPDTVARPFRPIYIHLLGGGSRQFTVAYNHLVEVYKVCAREWAEWMPFNNWTGLIAGPRVDAQPPLLAALNASSILDVWGRYIPHGHASVSDQVQQALTFRDAGNNIVGLRWYTPSNQWQFTCQQASATGNQGTFNNNIPLLRPAPPAGVARVLDFRIRWDRDARRANVWANGRQVINQMVAPDMGAITSLNVGRAPGGASQPRCSIKYLACRSE